MDEVKEEEGGRMRGKEGDGRQVEGGGGGEV